MPSRAEAPAPDAPREIRIVPRRALPALAARRMAETLRATVAARGEASLALAGGSTPRPVYERLAMEALPWSQLHVFFGDERAVPPVDPRSNYRMAREALLHRVPVPRDQVHRMEAEAEDLEEAARAYEGLLPGSLDLVVLGVGADGHTASLFPGSKATRERRRRVVTADGPGDGLRRLTLTPLALAHAWELVVVVSGADKAPAVARALEGDEPSEACPARWARRGRWFLDEEAAERLREPGWKESGP